jgi:DNA-binding IscR family transcriptional regulator
MIAHELALHLKTGPLTVEECAGRINRSPDEVVEIFSKLKKKNLVESDRLIIPDELIDQSAAGK